MKESLCHILLSLFIRMSNNLRQKGVSDKEMEWEHGQSNYQTENVRMQKCGTSQKADLSRKSSGNMQANRNKVQVSISPHKTLRKV